MGWQQGRDGAQLVLHLLPSHPAPPRDGNSCRSPGIGRWEPLPGKGDGLSPSQPPCSGLLGWGSDADLDSPCWNIVTR